MSTLLYVKMMPAMPIKRSFLRKQQEYLSNTFPRALIMPTAVNGLKNPRYKHKDGQWTVEKAYAHLDECFESGALILLSEDLIVVDIDDSTWVDKIESMFPMFIDTVTCNTKKGKHYYFRRVEDVKDFMFDGARGLKDDNGVIPIDIKTICKNGTSGVISIPPSQGKTWINPLGKHEILDLPDVFIEFYRTHSQSLCKQKKPLVVAALRAKPVEAGELCGDKEEVRALVKMLSPSRANERDDWMNVGWCLHCISPKYLDIWVEFSTTSDKYVEGECERLWDTMTLGSYTVASLYKWARDDNPCDGNDILMKNCIFNNIIMCDGSHNSVASIIASILKDKYVFASKGWFYFDGTLWKYDDNQVRLRTDFGTLVMNHFVKARQLIADKLPLDDARSKSSVGTGSKRSGSGNDTIDSISKTIMKLKDKPFKDHLVVELREFFLDAQFIEKLDSNSNLIAFTNGVWDLNSHTFRKAMPCDHLSISVKYDYDPDLNFEYKEKVLDYWATMHPEEEQRDYTIKMFACQLHGNMGQNLFHVHAGSLGSAANGKSTFFIVMGNSLGDYVRKFPVDTLTTTQKTEFGKPIPEYQNWKGRRILFCTEPGATDVLNSGVLKALTGGEEIQYRLLFSNETYSFLPQFKLHIMCNDPPQVDGGDSGVKRRIRKIDYISQFVNADKVDVANFMFLRDETFQPTVMNNNMFKMEFLRLLLDNYDSRYVFDMPKVVEDNSREFLEENDGVFQFASQHIVKASGGFFTLKSAKESFKRSDHFNGKIQTLKNDLIKVLKTRCIEAKRIEGVFLRNVFEGYRLTEMEQGPDLLD